MGWKQVGSEGSEDQPFARSGVTFSARAKSDSPALEDLKALRTGTPVFAVGNPLGFVGAVSSGVIHNVSMRRWLCADVQLAPGNSGGPLTSFSGQVVGINTMVMNSGLALAVPSSAADAIDEAANGLLQPKFYRGETAVTRSVTANLLAWSERTAA